MCYFIVFQLYPQKYLFYSVHYYFSRLFTEQLFEEFSPSP